VLVISDHTKNNLRKLDWNDDNPYYLFVKGGSNIAEIFFPKKFGDISTFGDMEREIIFFVQKMKKPRRRSKLCHVSNNFFNFITCFTIGSNEVNHQNA
jgi:hypothetical protein